MPRSRSRKSWWILWGILTLVAAGFLSASLLNKSAAAAPWLAWGKKLFLPGATSHGHYQIELACDACHTSAFGGKEGIQKSCVECHGADLQAANDSHPKRLFTDPRNADQLTRLDAIYCGSCHVEHKPEITRTGGITVAPDHCKLCHGKVGEERATHKDLGFETCANSSCHNYHDNQALYEDFLVKHANEPALSAHPYVAETNFRNIFTKLSRYPIDKFPVHALTEHDRDAPSTIKKDTKLDADWLATAHARSGVSCNGCHQNNVNKSWNEHPDQAVCATCHDGETTGWLKGRHGMRVDRGLSPMTPAQARLPMKSDAASRELSCNVCHAAHRFEVQAAAVQDCMTCHNDKHTLAYIGSPHHKLWEKEIKHEAPPNSGVNCATCHLPRATHKEGDLNRVLVEHNQNGNLRPNSKMIRSVCANCHGLAFSIDALADSALVANNFRGQPAQHVKSIEMAETSQHRSKSSSEKSAQPKP